MVLKGVEPEAHAATEVEHFGAGARRVAMKCRSSAAIIAGAAPFVLVCGGLIFSSREACHPPSGA